jgi:dUTPase
MMDQFNSLMNNIDTDIKAYLLGLISSDGYISNDKITIYLHEKDIELLEKIQNKISSNISLRKVKDNMVSLTILSTNISKNVMNHLGISENNNIVSSLPNIDDNLKWSFIRGYFDGNGFICTEKTSKPVCIIKNNSELLLKEIKEFTNFPCSIYENKIEWYGVSVLDFLGKIYMGSPIHMKSKYQQFISIINWKISNNYKLPMFKYSKTCNNAIAPKKSRTSDTGYDLHLIKKIKEVNGVHYFDTCIRVQAEYGYYFDLVGRSSISKTGWTLANNIGIIDQSYRGSIIVALVPVVSNPKPLELPSKLVQLIPRKVIILDEPEEVSDIEETDRNDLGGLGSRQFNNNYIK